MRPVIFTRQLVAGVVGAIAAAQTTAGAGNLVINGTLASGGVATMAAQQFVGLTSVGNLSAVNFTITGTDDQGRAISQTIAGPNANTVLTTLSYRTVTQIAVSAAVGTNVTADTVGSGASQELPVDVYVTNFNVSLFAEVTGVVNYTIQFTGDDVFSGPGPFNWLPVTGLLAQVANQNAQQTQIVKAFRILTNSGQGSVKLIMIQGGIGGT